MSSSVPAERDPLPRRSFFSAQRTIAVGGFCVVLAGMVGFGVPFANSFANPQQASSAPPQAAQSGGAAPAPPAQQKPAAGGKSSKPAGAKQKAGAPKPSDAGSTANTDKPASAADTKPPAPAAAPDAPPAANAVAPAPAASLPPADPALIAQGSDLFNRVYKCTDCHGDNSDGGDVGPKLAGIGSNRTVDELTAFLHKPSSMALGARMPPVDSDDEVKALIAYILSLKP